MLVFSRLADQSVVIQVPGAEPIIVTVCGYDRGKVKLGFTAAREVVIDRQEVHERKRAERIESTTSHL